jgi:hypothetical protein
MTEPLDRGRIDPVDASLKARVNCDDGLPVVRRAPCELPLSAANGPDPMPIGVFFRSLCPSFRKFILNSSCCGIYERLAPMQPTPAEGSSR